MLPRSFLFVRHGETEWNRQGVLQGFTDISLNDTGRAQAQAAIALLRDHPIDRIVCSPLARARETTDIINAVLKKPVSMHEGIRERHFGAFEGKNRADITRMRAEMQASGLPDEENGYPCPPGGETYGDFQSRIMRAITDELHATPEQAVMFVCHGGVYRVLRRSLIGDIEESPNVKPFMFEKTDQSWAVRALAGEVL